jgi:hypothetical protein
MPRFRDSLPLRIGVGIIAFWLTGILLFEGANFFFGYDPDAGPTFIWLILWMLVAFSCIAVGIGQTIVRRRSHRDI